MVEVGKENVNGLSMKCLFLVVFNKFFFLGPAYDIADTDLYIMDFKSFAHIDLQ